MKRQYRRHTKPTPAITEALQKDYFELGIDRGFLRVKYPQICERDFTEILRDPTRRPRTHVPKGHYPQIVADRKRGLSLYKLAVKYSTSHSNIDRILRQVRIHGLPPECTPKERYQCPVCKKPMKHVEIKDNYHWVFDCTCLNLDKHKCSNLQCGHARDRHTTQWVEGLQGCDVCGCEEFVK